MGLTRTTALDYAKQGIRVNVVNPGPIATDLMARSAYQMGITFDDLGSMIPMGRIGQAAEITQAVIFLCSDAASYIKGCLLMQLLRGLYCQSLNLIRKLPSL